MKKDPKKTSPYFLKMIDHIDQSWMRIKSMHYPFSGRDFKDLKAFTRNFQEWGIMALWDVFMRSNSDWVRKSGYSVSAFIKCLPWLVDDPGWKAQSQKYMNLMSVPMPDQLGELLNGMVEAKK